VYVIQLCDEFFLEKEIRRTNQESQFMFENICIEIWSIYEIMLKNEVVRDTKK